MDDILIVKYLMNEGFFNKEETDSKPYKHMVIDEYKAKDLVSKMYHYENGNKVSGEVFTMDRAKEIKLKYEGFISSNITVPQVYVAINALCHDYIELFRTWFGEMAEHKIIESAIIFWLKDDDYDAECKMSNYFSWQ